VERDAMARLDAIVHELGALVAYHLASDGR
jgi:hypothetical protein